jgi:ABC-type lipoprotein export system ATPase subunit
MIQLKNVSKIYRVSKEVSVTAVQDVDLSIEAGEFVVITGRSGSGKTTLLNLAAGLAKPSNGKVVLDGQDLWSMPDKAQSGQRSKLIGFIFQFPSLLPTLNTLDNVILPITFANGARPDDAVGRATELLRTVGLEEKVNAYPRQLSAGQQQRVVIARALMNQPRLLLADEPTSNLDERTEQEIMELFQQIHAETGITVVLVTHTNQLVRYGTRSIQMAEGHVVVSEAVSHD